MREILRVSSLVLISAALLVGPAALISPAAGGGYVPIEVVPMEEPHRPAPDTVVVVRGDHLWAISETHLEARTEGNVADNEIAPYWRRVIARNRNHLRSGDPDLIYPGEVVVLPEPG